MRRPGSQAIAPAPGHLLAIFAFAAVLRVAYTFWLQNLVHGANLFVNYDTFSFAAAFLNLYNHGIYSFDLTHPDASFFRPPVYPFFWGVHYILFGEANVFAAIAVSQSLLDAGSAVLICLIAARLGVRPAFALTAGLLHALNPFQLIWVPLSTTEITATFAALLIVYAILRRWLRPAPLFGLGLLIGAAVLLRQYLGIFIGIAGVSILAATRFDLPAALRPGLFLMLGFCTALVPWVLRNWVNHGAPYVLMGETRGYYKNGPDWEAFQAMFSKLDENVTPYFRAAAESGRVDLHRFDLSPELEADLSGAVALAHRCGPSFAEARGARDFVFADRDTACEARIIAAFDRARRAYRAEAGFFRYHATKLDALAKAFFKSGLTAKQIGNRFIDALVAASFYLRSVVILTAFASILFLRRDALITILFPAFMFVYIPVVTIHTEMRYLLQADAVLLPLFALTLHSIGQRLAPKSGA